MQIIAAVFAFIGRLLRRLVLLVAGAAAVVFTLLLGTALAVTVLAWAKLRGRPVVRVHRFGRRGPRAAQAADVVDVQVREVSPTHAPRALDVVESSSSR